MSQTVKVTFEEDILEVERISRFFGVEGRELTGRMQALAKAAFEEYLIEMSGVRSISTMREQRELRLYLLYKHFEEFGGLTETQIGELFQMTRRQVKNLITGTWARFRPELEGRQKGAIREAIDAGEWLQGNQVVRVELTDTLAGYVEDLLAETNTAALVKVAGMTRTYELDRETVDSLQRLGV